MQRVTMVGAVVLLVCVGAARAEAQAVASTFEQLSVLVKPGDKVLVMDAAGVEAEGRIGTLAPGELILVTAAGPRKLGERDVARIRQRRQDSLANGAVIGAVAGMAYFLTILAIFGDSDGGDVIVPTVIFGGVMLTGLGAAAGVGIDALITSRQVIYRPPAGEKTISVAPLVGRGRRGAAVTVRF
jgi:hypothetical protein